MAQEGAETTSQQVQRRGGRAGGATLVTHHGYVCELDSCQGLVKTARPFFPIRRAERVKCDKKSDCVIEEDAA